ncbi:MAG: hypothetical protein ACSHYF_17045 [Verrucomicrobiaceae bacterium]
MKYPAFLATFALAHTLLVAQPNTANLTLVDESGFNELDISVRALTLNDSDTAILTGFINISLNIDPLTGKTDQLGVTESEVAASDVSFNLSNFLLSAELDAKGLMGTASTPGGTSPVNEAGEFDAALHEVTINSGTLSGEANGDPINNDISETPITGTGAGTGTILLSNPVPGPNGRIDYDVTLTMPVTLSDDIPTGVVIFGNEVMATIQVSGTVKATGTTYTYLIPDYPDWAASQQLASNSQTSFDITPLMTNSLVHALGFDATNFPGQLLTHSAHGLTLAMASSPVRSNVTIEYSSDLTSWRTAPESHFTTGSPNLSPGHLGDLLLNPPGPRAYYRFVPSP